MAHQVMYYTIEKGMLDNVGIKPTTIMHAEKQIPNCQLWFCPICGVTYVKVVVLNSHSRFIAVRHECARCKGGDILLAKTRITLPGSILMEGYNTIDELSEEMLRRELLLELKAMKLLINQGVL